MFSKLVLSAMLLSALGCGPAKDAEIVAAVVTAELAQSQNALPSDISVEQVRFQDGLHAQVEATQRIPGARYSQRVAFRCDVRWTEGRWKVETSRRQDP